MAKGKAKVNYLGRSGVVMPQTVPSWDFIYETSTVKSEKYDIGDRVVLPDGREFYYGKSSAECASGQACEYVATGVQSVGVVLNSQAIGDKVLTLTGGTHDAIAKDELRGGFCVTWPAAKKDQFRGIIGNDASAEDADIKIYLDGKLTVAVVAATTAVEAYQNPFASLRTGSDASLAKAGVPAVYVSAASMYFWVQTGGFSFVAPQSTVIGNEGVGCMYRHDGSLEAVQTVIAGGATTPAYDSTQYAGHRVIGSYSGNGPLFLLK